MRVICEKCGADIAVEDLDLGRGMATCTACGNSFKCADQLDRMANGNAPSVEREETPMPKGTRVFRQADSLRIEQTWFGAHTYGVVVACLLWNGVWLATVGRNILDRPSFDAAFPGALFAIPGLLLAYAAVTCLLNSTTITVMDGLLRISHGPIWVPGNKKIRAKLLQQLYTKTGSHSDGSSSSSHELLAQLSTGLHVKLVSHLQTPEQALFLEQEIEQFLGITDRPIRGEIER